MDKIKKEIDDLTTQKSWKVPDKIWEILKPIHDDKEALAKDIVTLELNLNYLKAKHKIRGHDFWTAIERNMPHVPSNESLHFDLLNREILLCDNCGQKNSGIKEFIERIKRSVPPGSFVGGFEVNPGGDGDDE